MHRSIKALSQVMDAEVIHLRAWRPGRPLVERRQWEAIDVVSVACPQLPLGSYSHLNTLMLSLFGGLSVKSYVSNADIVHALDIYPAGFVASLWSHRWHKPHTSHVIGSDLNLFLIPNLRHLGTGWVRDFSGIVCNSQAIKAQLMGLIPELCNVNVIYRGVDTSAFSPTGPASGPQASLPPLRFLYVGGFHTWNPRRGEYNIKGGHVLLDAWSEVEGRIGPSSLVIGGPGADTANIRKWRAGLRRPEAVFITDSIPPDAMAAWMRASDVVVIPSLQEGLPNVANEAQACARAVLATNAGGTPESVVHEATGQIVQRGDVGALAQGMQWFWTSRSKVAAMGQQGRRRMVQHFSWDRFSQEMLVFLGAAL